MASTSLDIAVPTSRFVNPETGEIEVPWRQFLISLWSRTGGTVNEGTAALRADLTAETAARISGDTANSNAIQAEANTRATADATEGGTRRQRDNTLAARQIKAGEVTAANPPNLTGVAYKMLGLGLTLTPDQSTRTVAHCDGQIGNTTNNGQTNLQLCYGTGTPPAWNAPQTGTLLGQPVKFLAAAGGDYTPFAQSALITGLTLNMQIWIDIAVSVPAGTSIITDVGLVAYELLDAITLPP